MLVKKSSLILLPIILFLVLNMLSRDIIFSNYVYPSRYKHDLFPEPHESFDYVVLGHSHARDSFDFNLVEKKGLNLALSAQNLYWNQKMLEKYETFFHEDTVVIIEVSYATFCQADRFGQIRYVPLGFDHKEVGITFQDYLLEKYFPLIGFNSLELIFSSSEHRAIRDSDFNSEEELIQNAIEYAKRTSQSELCDSTIYENNFDILNDIVKSQTSKGREVIIYSAPVHNIVVEVLNDNFDRLTLKRTLVHRLKNNYLIHFYEDYYVEGISTNNLYFRNANHLNSAGVHAYMNHFFNNLED